MEAAIIQSFMEEDYKATIKGVDELLAEDVDHPKKINLTSLKARSQYLGGIDRNKAFCTMKSVMDMDGRFRFQVWAGVANFYSTFEGSLSQQELQLGFSAAKKSKKSAAVFEIVQRIKTEIETLEKEPNKNKTAIESLKKTIQPVKDIKRPKTAVRSPFRTGLRKPIKNRIQIGDKLPSISARGNWLKGASVPKFENGKIYVIDLWATWCGPCIAAMPHVSKVADEYKSKNVVVIGVAFDPKSSTPTEEFVDKNQKKIRYRICEDIKGQLKQDFFDRIGLAGIPTILIVNKDGVLAWIGHPKNMDEPLEQIVAGKYDLAKAKKMFRNFQQSKPNPSRSSSRKPVGKSKPDGRNKLVVQLFDKADKDGDGLLSADELSKTFAPNGRVMFDPRRIVGADANGDKKLSKKRT